MGHKIPGSGRVSCRGCKTRIRDLLSRLGRVRKTTERSWQATCPAHPDETRNLTVSLGEDGRILVDCHAGCSTESIVKAVDVTLADLFQSEPTAGRARESISASNSPTVADWLRTARKISGAEIACMHARETSRGMAVAFRYQRVDGHPLYEKVRLIGAKKFWRIPARSPSVLYGLPATDSANVRVIITESELDVHALRSAGIDPVVSVPDGTGSHLTPELLAPLERFSDVLIATDADEPGEEFARRLAEALGRTRCRRMRFSDGDRTFKDAGDALNAGWARAEFDAAISAARTFDETPSNDNTVDDNPHRVVGGRICNIRTDQHGNETVQPLCDFNPTASSDRNPAPASSATTVVTVARGRGQQPRGLAARDRSRLAKRPRKVRCGRPPVPDPCSPSEPSLVRLGFVGDAPAPANNGADRAVHDDVTKSTPTAQVDQALPKVLTPDEVAALLRIRPRSVYEAITRGDIPGVRRIGRKVRVDRDRILEWLANGQGRVSRSSRR